jgi:hypothetical protein
MILLLSQSNVDYDASGCATTTKEVDSAESPVTSGYMINPPLYMVLDLKKSSLPVSVARDTLYPDDHFTGGYL